MPYVKHCIIKAGLKEVKRHAYISFFFKRPTISALFLFFASKKALEAARLAERFVSLSLTWKKRDFHDVPRLCGITCFSYSIKACFCGF